MPDPVRPRGVDVLPFPSSRRAVTAAVRAGRRIVPMHGLVDVDVTEARRLLGALNFALTAELATMHPDDRTRPTQKAYADTSSGLAAPPHLQPWLFFVS